MVKKMIQRFKEEKPKEELLIQLGKIKQTKATITQLVEQMKDLVRQLFSPPREKSMRAWFVNGTSLKDLKEVEKANPTKGFEKLIWRAKIMERKTTKKRNRFNASTTSTLQQSSNSQKE